MKNIYIAPSLDIVEVKVKASLLAGSDPNTQTLSVTEGNISDGSQIGSRRQSSLWDDDEEE
ncbi:MAG: hypothetical protein J6Z14_08150 [Prevotella sp.]|nr:hypothetical protein [Prevotella sp.]